MKTHSNIIKSALLVSLLSFCFSGHTLEGDETAKHGPKVLRCARMELIDTQGNERAQIGIDPITDNPTIYMLDKIKRTRLSMYVDSSRNRNGISLADSNGIECNNMGCFFGVAMVVMPIIEQRLGPLKFIDLKVGNRVPPRILVTEEPKGHSTFFESTGVKTITKPPQLTKPKG